MSLIRQVWLLLLGMIVLACAACVGVSVWTAHDGLQAQLSLRNQDGARVLAALLAPEADAAAALEQRIGPFIDGGLYRRITLKAADGRVLAERSGEAVPSGVPGWFIALVPVRPAVGVAPVGGAAARVGSLEVESQLAPSHATLWATTLRMAGVLAVLGVLGGIVGWVAVQQIRRPLAAVVEQATALTERRFVTIGEPAAPELRRVAQALNAMVTRVRVMFNEQVEQIEHLRHVAHCDPRTGVADRRQFMGRLHDELAREDGGGRGLLVLMRFQHLGQANQQLGHAGTDAMLQLAARGLEQAVDAALPLLAGRLNGSDFAVLFDAAPEGERVVRVLLGRAQGAFAPFAQAAIVASVTEWQRGDAAPAILQAADAALARAELRGHGSHERVAIDRRAPITGGEEQWRRGLAEALEHDHVALGSYPLVNASGHLVHQECPLRIGIGAHGDQVPAAVWLPLAVRTGMVARIDRVGAAMALAAIDDDGAQRGINVALGSLQDPGFVPGLRALAEEHPEAAPRLSIDVDESALALGMPALAELCHQLRPLGVRVGIEHAGERTAQAQALLAVGLDYIKLRASFVAGVAGNSAQAALVRGTLAVFHGLGLMVYAEGVQSPQDLQTLWMLGIDGVTGPVLEAVAVA